MVHMKFAENSASQLQLEWSRDSQSAQVDNLHLLRDSGFLPTADKSKTGSGDTPSGDSEFKEQLEKARENDKHFRDPFLRPMSQGDQAVSEFIEKADVFGMWNIVQKYDSPKLNAVLEKLSPQNVARLIDKLEALPDDYRPYSGGRRGLEETSSLERVQNYWRREIFNPNVRQATPDEYREWLKGHLAAGGRVTHVTKVNFPDSYLIAINDIAMPKALWGTNAVSLIVPKGKNVNDSAGHSRIYFMDGFRKGAQTDEVVLWNDIR